MDTTEKAEFEIRGLQIPDSTMERIASRLRDVTFSFEDRVVGAVRVRELEGYEVVFLVGREDQTLVVTIGAVEVPNPDDPVEAVLKRLGPLAILRGASGL
ncbi:hypothetical protein P1J78_19545 [Psychromarinibacter sp. C21-152]|uniref:Uncharacterized protein n=1 Tax=Psychromarinibacter sediminicola TaxID=3033385 RepID=A0AAE3NRH6_9RHOB|nr:hypothetical protein [Psychromarinibacter sediminicola]MDF0602943.1 hypothetical protein [Psychromarinibacter sediminicola]